MTEFRFRLPLDWKLSAYHASSVFVVGLDGIPWPCKVSIEEVSKSIVDYVEAPTDYGDSADSRSARDTDPFEESVTVDGSFEIGELSGESDSAANPSEFPIMTVTRNQEESGRLYFVYPFAVRGEMLICTGTLPRRNQPYDLMVELARGTLNRLRNQISIWQEGGLIIGDEINVVVSQSIRRLGRSIMMTDKREQDRIAQESLESGMDAMFDLSDTFSMQIAKFRRENKYSQFWICTAAGSLDQAISSGAHPHFDLLQIDGSPKSIKSVNGKVARRLVVGPWLDASVGGFPKELEDAEDFIERSELLLTDVRKKLAATPESTSLLHLVSGINGIGHRKLSYPQQLQTIVDMLHIVEESPSDIPVLISFDFPWAERMAGAVGGVHPLQIADSLLRQGLPISFLGLDINLDYWPNGSAVRDPLQWIDLIDVWAQLDLPLIICLRAPFGGQPAPPAETIDRLINHQQSNLNDAQRIAFLKTVLPMLVSRPSVHGIIWRQWQDGDDIRFPNGGFVDDSGEPKATAEVITNLRGVIDGKPQ